MILVVDYGVANLGSMLNMLKKCGVAARADSSPDAVRHATRIILPGVGAFDHGVAALSRLGLVEPLRERVLGDGVPILGVCLGMQLLARGSEEGVLAGLGMIDGRCVRFPHDAKRSLKVPHMGWNRVIPRRRDALLDENDSEARFYFVHSYHLECTDASDVLASTHYGIEFTSVVQRRNVRGVQFHPEKSHRFGLSLLQRFAEI